MPFFLLLLSRLRFFFPGLLSPEQLVISFLLGLVGLVGLGLPAAEPAILPEADDATRP